LSPAVRERLRLRVGGTVQGVGFRPHVYRLATELGLAGWVLNDEEGVLIEVEGASDAVERFAIRLPLDAPPLAEVESVVPQPAALTGAHSFEILESTTAGAVAAPVSPDIATCKDCLCELFDPDDRRFRYPFINCTNCGPRFTIVRGVPYDRPLTTMAGFDMCVLCRREYDNPRDRRFHAQPNACVGCGPTLRLIGVWDGRDPLKAAAAALMSGAVVAVKGLGGYQLACRADDEDAVAALRARKHREDKPLALMVPDLESARELVELTRAEEVLLAGRERPIVIARRRAGAAVANSVAPHSRDLGVMLPYTPLHHLLLHDIGTPIVMTSGNVSDEPIAFVDQEAEERLAGIADLFLVHDRPIHMRTDDSVVRSVSAGPVVLRRSRGYVPGSIDLPLASPRPVLAMGAELKSTFCVAKGRRAWVGHHIGDLENWETLRSFREGIEHFQRLFAVEPEVVAHDLHPDYLSTKEAVEREGVEFVGVQHHHAHLAACLAEHGETGPAVGAIFDGTGYGADGTIWGGEFLVGDLRGFERRGLLHPVRLPGGTAAIREPWRMACAWLAVAFGVEEPEIPPLLESHVDPERWSQVCELVGTGVSSPLTTSAGRLFDAVSAICGIRAEVNYEGQAAAELEGVADPAETLAYDLPIEDERPLVLDAGAIIRQLVAELGAGAPVAAVAARFHNGLAEVTAEAGARIAEDERLGVVVLSGGVFQNRLLLERTESSFARRGLKTLRPRRLPPNDGGVSYGQAAVAAAQLATIRK
jgi:hydrogenase maturation protein HypF